MLDTTQEGVWSTDADNVTTFIPNRPDTAQIAAHSDASSPT